MAKLHRRVPRLPDPLRRGEGASALSRLLGAARAGGLTRSGLGLVGLLALALAQTSPVAAQARADRANAPPEVAEDGDPRLVALERLAAGLASPAEDERRRAFDGLSGLTPEDIPAIRARLAALRRSRPPENWRDDLLNRFRRRANDGEEDGSDMALGALRELGREHREQEHEYALQLAEPLFLWRALQGMGTHEANLAALDVVGFDDGAWMAEARNWVRREGRAVTAAVIVARSHDDRFVRQWGRWGTELLRADEPGRAVQELDDAQLADVLRAYATVRVQGAMRVIVSYVDSERRGIRRAARWAMEQYGGNGIWILRTAYRNETGEHPPRAWGWRELTAQLYERVDTRRYAPVQAALDAGLAARDRGDFSQMRASFDDVLARATELEDAGPVAEGYAAAAAHARGATEARADYLRALRLAPDHASAGRWRSSLAFLEAERMRADGVVDQDAYREVLAEDPSHAGAARVLAALVPTQSPAPSSRRRTPAAIAAILLLVLLGLGLAWRGRGSDGREDFAHDATLDAPTFDEADATLADTTLPG